LSSGFPFPFPVMSKLDRPAADLAAAVARLNWCPSPPPSTAEETALIGSSGGVDPERGSALADGPA
jgi:hypothetical protein